MKHSTSAWLEPRRDPRSRSLEPRRDPHSRSLEPRRDPRSRSLEIAALASAAAPPAPDVGTVAAIDAALRAEWKKQGATPAPPADDATFLRRIHLDLNGDLPAPDEVLAFVADRSPGKRARAVDALLERPRFAERWADYWDGVLMGRLGRAPLVDRGAFRRWLRGRFARNAPWNEIVTDLVTATGVSSPGGPRRPWGSADASDDEDVNGAVNWILRYARTPEDLAGTTSRVFLGVQIQCAQCHDHKTEAWTQEDFRRFTAAYMRVRPVPVDRAKDKGELRRVALEDVERPFLGRGKNARPELGEIAALEPRALDGTPLATGPDRRRSLAAWIVDPKNPWFARAIVNRMWALMLGKGFVEPIDDLRPSTPGLLPEVQRRLEADFVAHGYDLRHLLRTICATEAYQLSSGPAAGSAGAPWARFPLKPLAPEVLVDVLVQATGIEPVLEDVAGDDLERLRFRIRQEASFVFEVDEEAESADYEGTIPQALMLQNGPLAAGASAIPGAALDEVLALPGTDADKIRALYLRTLSREPSAAELARWTAFVHAPRDVVAPGAPRGGAGLGKKLGKRLASRATTAEAQAYEDLLWALINSSELAFNH